MARHEEFRPSNPTSKYLDWDQNLKTFSYWDKELETPARVPFPLPFKFVVIRQRYAVMGFTNDGNKNRIYSNEIEVQHIGSVGFNVRIKEGTIEEGYWRDIKDRVKDYGGSLYRIIHAVYENEIICLRVKGSGLWSWGLIVGHKDKAKNRRDEFVSVTGFAEAEGGDDNEKYTYPTFNFAGSFTTLHGKKVDELDAQMDEYYAFVSQERAARVTQNPQAQIQVPQQRTAPTGPQQPAKSLMPTAPAAQFVLEDGNDEDLPF